MGLWMLLVPMLVFVPVTVKAEVVSIMLASPGYDGMMVEAAMKLQLREEGYTVRTGTAEGIAVILNVIAPKTTQGHQPGYVGNVTVVTSDWQQVGELFVAEPCRETHNTAQAIKEMVGAPILLIDTAMGAASNPDDLANMLITSINPSIRKSFQTMQAFFTKLDEAAKTKQQSEIVNPLR